MEEPSIKKRKFTGQKLKVAPQIRRNRPPPLTAQDQTYVPQAPQFLSASTATDELGHHHGPTLGGTHGHNQDSESATPDHEGTTKDSKTGYNTNEQSQSESLVASLFSVDDWPHNRKGFRYGLCVAQPSLSSVLYSSAEVEPKRARLSYEDKSPQAFISQDGLTVSTFKGFRSARANVFMAEGDWYFEVKVLNSEVSESASNSPVVDSPIPERTPAPSTGHVRLGIARREASLEAPVGHDAYGYGLRDVTGEKVHISRPVPFMNEPFGVGDVIGFHVSIPSRQQSPVDVFRDRFPIWYKGQHFFEFLDYVPTKRMESLILPTTAYKKKFKDDKSGIATIPGSFVKIYKNGRDMGIAFSDLKDFLPPNSKLSPALAVNDVANDGCLGYYPIVSVFQGGTARFNFGPNFHFPIDDVKHGKVRPLCERYDEQIAEDIVYDLVDQVGYEEQDKLDDDMQAEKTAQEQEQLQKEAEARARERAQRAVKTETDEPAGVAISQPVHLDEEAIENPEMQDGTEPAAPVNTMSIQSMISTPTPPPIPKTETS